MIRLERSETLQRTMCQDDVTDLGISTMILVRNAIKAGRVKEALDFIDYELAVVHRNIDSFTFFRDMALTRLASFGEEEIEKIHRERFSPWTEEWLSTTPGIEKSLQRFTENLRLYEALLANSVTITDESDRYVMRLNHTGHKLLAQVPLLPQHD